MDILDHHDHLGFLYHSNSIHHAGNVCAHPPTDQGELMFFSMLDLLLSAHPSCRPDDFGKLTQ
jgi:hypothetical protein